MMDGQGVFVDASSDVDVDRRAVTTQMALMALLVVAIAQVSRVLFPIMFEIGEDWDFLHAGLVALATFVAPLAALVVRMKSTVALVGGSGIVAATLVLLRAVDPIPAWLAVVCVALALIGVTTVATRAGFPALVPSGALVPALITGLGIDAALRAAFGSWDLAWQHSVASLIVVLAVATGIVVLAVRASPQPAAAPRPMRPALWVAVGSYLMIQLLFLQNFAFVGSQAALALPAAVLVVLVGDVAALGAVHWSSRIEPWPGIGWAVTAALVGLAWTIPIVKGVASAIIVIVLHAVLAGTLARAAVSHSHRAVTATRSVLGATAGSMVFLALVLVWSLHIDQPLPIPRQSLPAIAALVVALVGVRSIRHGGDASGSGGWQALAIGTVALFALLIPLGLWVTHPAADVSVRSLEDIRIVSYNARGSVDTEGQLAPDRIAAEVASSDPDIVVLQEAGRGWAIHGTLDLVAYLQRALEMNYLYVPAADGQFGNAIFSKLPMREMVAGLLPKDGSQERSFIVVQIETGSDELIVAGTHIQSRSVVQVTALLDAIDATSRLVVAGDMNIAPDDPEVALFTTAGLIDAVGATGDPCRTTSAEPTSDCDRPDWLFVSPDIEVVQLRIGTGEASDHLAIHATLALPR